MTDRSLSVVIVNWNAGDALAATLRSLVDNPPTLPVEVVIVDNGSTDGSVEAAAVTAPHARIIRNAENRGLAAANNQGVVATTGGLILISNPDVRYGAGTVDAMVAVMDRHQRAGVVVPRLRYADGTLQTSAGDLPTLADALLGRQAQRLRGRHRTPGSPSGFWWDGWAHDEERSIGRGHEAAYLVRRAAVAQAGLQDEAFRLDWEGVDWTARFRDAGWEIWLAPAAEVVHLGGVSIRQVQFRWVVSSHRGMYRYFAKRRAPGWRPILAVLVTARAAAKLMGAVARVTDYQRGHR